MKCNFDVGSFIYHKTYGYGEITTVNEDHSKVFIDFRQGHCDWFDVCYLERGDGVFPAENAFIRVLYTPGDKLKDILQRYPEYRFIDILF